MVETNQRVIEIGNFLGSLDLLFTGPYTQRSCFWGLASLPLKGQNSYDSPKWVDQWLQDMLWHFFWVHLFTCFILGAKRCCKQDIHNLKEQSNCLMADMHKRQLGLSELKCKVLVCRPPQWGSQGQEVLIPQAGRPLWDAQAHRGVPVTHSVSMAALPDDPHSCPLVFP